MSLTEKSAGPFSSVRSDGRVVVDVNRLIHSEQARKYLKTLQQKIQKSGSPREKSAFPTVARPEF